MTPTFDNLLKMHTFNRVFWYLSLSRMTPTQSLNSNYAVALHLPIAILSFPGTMFLYNVMFFFFLLLLIFFRCRWPLALLWCPSLAVAVLQKLHSKARVFFSRWLGFLVGLRLWLWGFFCILSLFKSNFFFSNLYKLSSV